ncbi:MAG: hypothetical protein EXQ52_02545 [Bryobacterales bacterium]|nr:hypothetical protein [Bryobacterales bacterium]
MLLKCVATLVCFVAPAAWALDLSRAVVVAPPGKAPQVLIEEVEKRTGIRWTLGAAAGAGAPAIRLAVSPSAGPAESYRIEVNAGNVSVTGADARGLLFGAGRLLLTIDMRKGGVSIADSTRIASSPKYPLRGHQLGYRPKTNSYDAWDVPMWEQYIRDLAVFGTNAIELIPPRSDDDADSPHFPIPPMRMMVEMSRISKEYGLDVWIWYPAMDKDYSDPKTVEFALSEWEQVYKQLPRIDAIFVPGGDPGHTQPKYLFALLEKQTALLHKYHPKAQMWMSPQSFNREWMDEFYGLMRKDPAWLSGIVFGPQTRGSLSDLRAALPAKVPIRHYPDITHSRQAQYPVPGWDVAYALTEARETINPRPLGQARIFRLLQPLTMGFLTYSEGCNDDVNKFVWSALGWNPNANVTDALRDYSRYFIGAEYADTFAQGLLALERNWRGPLLTNGNVETALSQFQSMERSASPHVLLNWRFQQALYRAYYDAYTRSRLIAETAAEESAMSALRSAGASGALNAMSQAEAILNRPVQAAPALRARIFELAEALYQSVRMQLSVPRYKAISVDRGANLDTVDVPLNSRAWLEARFTEIRKEGDEKARLKALDEIVNWTNPGPGGYYDDLGKAARQPHLVRGVGFDDDPAFLRSALTGFGRAGATRSSWWDHAESLNDTPLEMRYTDLDSKAGYKIRIVYAGDGSRGKLRLTANGIEVHPWMEKPMPFRPVEFDIPAGAVSGAGELKLSFTREAGLGGNGRGCQVAEVWLIRK